MGRLQQERPQTEEESTLQRLKFKHICAGQQVYTRGVNQTQLRKPPMCANVYRAKCKVQCENKLSESVAHVSATK